MWQDLLDELEKIAKKSGNHFWLDVSWKEEGKMLRKLWKAVLAENVLTPVQIQTFLAHVLFVNSVTPCLKEALPDDPCTLEELSRELLFIDEKVKSICIDLFGRPLLPDDIKKSIAKHLDEPQSSVDIFTGNSEPAAFFQVQRQNEMLFR